MSTSDEPDDAGDQLPAELLAQLRAPVPVDPEVRDRHLATALARLGGSDHATAHPSAPVIPLAPRRRRTRWITAAAAVIVVAGGVWLAGRGGSGSPTQTAERAVSSTSAPARAAAAGTGAAVQAPVARAPVGTDSFGTTSFGRDDQMGTAQLAQPSPPIPNDAAAAAPSVTASDHIGSCHAPTVVAPLLTVGASTVDGVTKLVYTYAGSGSTTFSVEVDPRTCTRF